MRVGSLCSGYAGDHLALGGDLAYVADPDKGAAALLAHRLPDVPNLGDITRPSWTIPPVHLIVAGIPCQGWSQAGRQLGVEDDRHLWPDVARGLLVSRPDMVLIENVPGMVQVGVPLVIGDLHRMGYDSRWVSMSASSVGAPHRRMRVFILGARRGSFPEPGWSLFPSDMPGDTPTSGSLVDGRFHPMPAPNYSERLALMPTPAARDHKGPSRPQGRARRDGRVRNQSDESLADTLERAATRGWREHAEAVRRWGITTGRPAPDPADHARTAEWLMGLPDGWVTDVPGLTRVQKLTLIGNGIVPQQLAAAWTHLSAGVRTYAGSAR